MKLFPASLIAAVLAAVPSTRSAEPSLAEVQQELALVKARLELADAKLALAKKTEELARLTPAGAGNETAKPARPGETTKPEEKTAEPDAAAAQKSEKEAQAAASGLWQRGVKSLNAMTPSRRERLLAFNHIYDPDKEESRNQATDKLSPFDQALQSGPPTPFRTPGELKGTDTADKLGAFLVRAGYDARLDDATKGAAAPGENDKKAADAYGFNGVITPPAFNVDAKLRNAGISFASGAGVILHRDGGGGDASAGTVVARWNLIQRYATARWNQRVGDRNLDGYGLVSSYGNIEFRSEGLLEGIMSGRQPTSLYRTHYQRGARDNSVLPNLTFVGPFLGSTVLGEKIREPGSTAADNKTERPYLLGISLGWGFYDEASSLAYLDFGKTISPHKGMQDTRTYLGVSFDAVVFSKIMSGVRGTASDAAAAK